MLLMEIVLVMKLAGEGAKSKCLTLGVRSAVMIILGYPGELIAAGALCTHWLYWFLDMIPFCYIVYELLVGLAIAAKSESNGNKEALILRALCVTVISWLTYLVAYVFPMLGCLGRELREAASRPWAKSAGVLEVCT